MSQENYSTERARKGSHLTYEERIVIEVMRKEGKGIRAIARELGRAPSTISNEVVRGTVDLYNGKVQRYKAKQGQQGYEAHRKNSRRGYKMFEVMDFMNYVTEHMDEAGADRWSVDACHGRALRDKRFKREQIVCTKTLYNYIDMGILPIKNLDLPRKVSLSRRAKQVRENRRKLGRSIEERDPAIDTREEFGHWECDLVIGSKSGEDQCLLTMLERKTRELMLIPLANKESESVMAALRALQRSYGDRFSSVFKTITTDNGSEFASLSRLEQVSETLVYYAHPYTSCEKGSIENHNGLIRRFIPKGKRIDDYSLDAIMGIELWANGLPRRILGYATPDECFEAELDRIYQVV